MVIVSQDGMLFVNLDRISCVKILHRGPGMVDILAIDNGNSERLGAYRSESDAYKVMSAIYINHFTGWDVMYMPDKTTPTIINTTRGHSQEPKETPDLNGHSCSTCKRGDGSLGCQYCHGGSMWEAKE